MVGNPICMWRSIVIVILAGTHDDAKDVGCVWVHLAGGLLK